jgi:hypothetical protein
MEIDELFRQAATTCTVLAQEGAQRQGPMGRCLLLDRDADPERRVAILDKGCKPLAKSAGAGEKIDDAESRRQIRLLTNFIQPVYTRFRDENQDACDRYRGSADPVPHDGRDQGKGHEARASAKAGVARARFPIPAPFEGGSRSTRPRSAEVSRRQSSCMAVSGIATRAAATAPPRRRALSSGRRSSTRMWHVTAPFGPHFYTTDGAWGQSGHAR